MIKFRKIGIILCSVFFIFAIKTEYGGEITLRLNEPSGFSYSPSNYSNLIFYSLIYENLFYLRPNGEIFSNLFSEYSYQSSQKVLVLTLKKNLSFSSGQEITPPTVKISIQKFLNLGLFTSRRLSGVLKEVRIISDKIYLDLLYDYPDILTLLSTPDLVLISGDEQTFSGMFLPTKWEKGKSMILSANHFYAGGRSYLDSIKVIFFDTYYPDIFLGNLGLRDNRFTEKNAGMFHNIYLTFPTDGNGQSSRIALYSLLKEFFKTSDLIELNSLTTDEESPVSIKIKQFTLPKVKSILYNSKIQLYIVSSLKEYEKKLEDFFKLKGLKIQIIFIDDNELMNFLNNTSIHYLLVEKMFNQRMAIDEKVKKIVQEMSYKRLNEKYLNLLNELEEIRFLKNDELLTEQVAKIIEKMVNDGFVLPLFQQKYSLYINKDIEGIEMDCYGRPLFQKIRMEKPKTQ